MTMSRVILLLLPGVAAFAPPGGPHRQPIALFTSRPQVESPSISRSDRDKLMDSFNTQITREMEASQTYLAASIWMDRCEMVGMANFMRAESDEERSHALSMIDFASKRDIDISLEDIEAPDSDWETPEDVWSDLLDCERQNTQALLNLADAAQTCHDHSITTFLMPFHMEQVNSEDKLRTILAKVKDENKTPGLLRQLDHELGLESTG